jgi:hypothetical protein
MLKGYLYMFILSHHNQAPDYDEKNDPVMLTKEELISVDQGLLNGTSQEELDLKRSEEELFQPED